MWHFSAGCPFPLAGLHGGGDEQPFLCRHGNLLIFCVGWNLIHTDKPIRVANMLPSLVVAVVWSFLEGALGR